MFSSEEKKKIAGVIEKVLLELNHPEMPKEKPKFKLHVLGNKRWCWADIEPNWVFEDKELGVNPWNEQSKEQIKKQSKIINKIVGVNAK